ncbi:MAG TPA: AAA family ATPase [Candidatus Baltobacteraceae bacterium]|nr:AAA family ATPase [Candidatus Baltobacteraceae bacterium]
MLTRALVCPTLVGRDEELTQLVECRLAAARGHGSLVLVSGDAGIGKSRLLIAFRQTLTGGRAALGVGLNREFGNAPYGAVLAALRSLRNDVAFPQAGSRIEQLTELAEQLSAMCARRCTVLILEDVHWADDGTLLFLQHLLPSIGTLRLLIVATYRSDDLRRCQQLDPHIARLMRSRASHSIALKPLAPAEIRRLVRLAAGQKPPLTPALVDEIVERCEGNPFFAEELLKTSIEKLQGAGIQQLPLTVRATVLERVAGLDQQTHGVLSRAAVLGRRFEAGLLSELCRLDPTTTLAALRTLRNLQLIDELDADPPAYVFRHALTQEAVYNELLAAERKPLHARILSVLESRGADAAQLGYHAWCAGIADKCVSHNENAGDEAQALHVYGDAVRCYDRAIAFAPNDDARARLLVKSAVNCARDGKAVQALERYAAAADAYRACGLSDRLPDIYQAMSAQARTSGDNERGVQILEHALDSMSQDDARERALMYLSLVYLRLDRGEVDAAKALIAQANVMRGSMPYEDALQYTQLVAGDVAGFQIASKINAAAKESLGDVERLRARFNRAFGLTILGCDDDALVEFNAILPELNERRLTSLEVLSCANSALIHARAGRLSEARGCIDRAVVIPEPTTTGPIALAAAALTVGFALWDEDLIARLCSADVVEAAFASRINSTLGRIAGPYAKWLWVMDRRGEARALLRRAMDCIHGPFGATETLLVAAELGDERARSAAFASLETLDRMVNADAYAATSAHLRALRALHAGDESSVRAHAREALERYVRLGWTMHQAACMQLCGDAKRASVLYRRMHAAGPLRQMLATSRDSGVRAALSEREREIASLVAHGTVNKHIAERLAVNQRTVEKHLTSIYEKLGLRNRSELAAYVTRGQEHQNLRR